MEDLQVREERWVIADRIGKGKHFRTVPVPLWAKRAVDEWTSTAAIDGGPIFRRVSRLDNIGGDGITPRAIWHIVKAAAKRAGIRDLALHGALHLLHAYTIWRAGNLNRFSSCFATLRLRQRNVISAASRNSAKQ